MNKEQAIEEAATKQYLINKIVENTITKKQYKVEMVNENIVTDFPNQFQVLCSFASTEKVLEGDVKRNIVEEIGYFLRNYIVISN